MCEDSKEDIGYILENIVSLFAEDYYDGKKIVDEVIDDVIEDVRVCADEDYNESDVAIAFTRVLKKRLGIEE